MNNETRDITKNELFDLLRDERKQSETRIMAHIDTVNNNVVHLVEHSIAEYHKENNKLIANMFPMEHSEDHTFIKTARNGVKSFFSGLFGALGKFILIVIGLGILLQIASVMEFIKIDKPTSQLHSSE